MSVIRRRDILHSTLAAIPTMLSCGRAFAAMDSAPSEDVEAVTGYGREIVLRAADVEDFAARMRGPLMRATSAGYQDARRVWNGAFDRHPALIARCTGAADVIEAVKFAAAHELLVSVRGGGHSLSGQSVCEKGLMIDLSQMNSVRVDPARRMALVEGGALLGALDREALAQGLVTTAGTVSHTGVGGLTLGGGFGRLARIHGLTCDNVRSIDVVTASGTFVNAAARENPDLFWGLRGGGGNFGVATAFEFQLHPVDPVMLGGDLVYSIGDAPAVLKFYFDWYAQAPDELYADAALVKLPDDQRLLSVGVCYCGALEKGQKLIAPLRQVRKPLQDGVKAQPYAAIQSSGDEGTAHGHKFYVKHGFVQTWNPAMIDLMLGLIGDASLPVLQAILTGPCGGAIRRIKPEATAFAQRAAQYNTGVFCRWDDPTLSAAVTSWGRSTWAKMEPFTRGFYVNEYNADDASRLRTTYGPNFERMVALKTKYDPRNLFRLNANVEPRKS